MNFGVLYIFECISNPWICSLTLGSSLRSLLIHFPIVFTLLVFLVIILVFSRGVWAIETFGRLVKNIIDTTKKILFIVLGKLQVILKRCGNHEEVKENTVFPLECDGSGHLNTGEK